MKSVIIIGGGVIARCCALALQRQGMCVTVLARHDETPASYGNAGHIAAEQVEPLPQWSTLRTLPWTLFPMGPVALDFRYPLAWLPWSVRFLRACRPAAVDRGRVALRWLQGEALPAWERLDASLPGPTLLQRDGTVKLWEGPSATARARAAVRADCGTATARLLTTAEIGRIGAGLSVPAGAGAHYAGTAHVISPRDVLERLAHAFIDAGGEWRDDTAIHVAQEADGAVVAFQDRSLRADAVLVAGGVTSGALLPHLRVPMIAERGYHIEWDHGGAYDLPNLVFEDRALVVTRFGPRLRATSFVEFTKVDASPDPRKWAALERHVRALGLPVASAFAHWHGARPTLPDYLPMLGRLADQPRVFVAFGHNHLGLTLAATTAERMATHMLEDVALPAVFSPDRFT
ncbi:NAD(P)/FAD-dependent oxidoreductase [Gluconacetobacter asukensis]|uniref:NAD(P)/FAD-dependent oxidoreductase n=1 Tax=Gluconacetobacter asukensis TaxID=1017181 RepID=UPI001C820C4C|nr:FAD-binding oxidoreductase [Gluconacetobacter asukensis]